MFLHFQDNKESSALIEKKRQLIHEQTTPFHQIMWVYNALEPQRRSFENGINAFHIGNGYFLSVAHNLRLQAGYLKSVDEDRYRQEIFSKLDGSQSRLLDQYYFTDAYTRKKYINNTEPATLQTIAGVLKQKRYDTRWETLAAKNICSPYVVFQFKEEQFYGDTAMGHYLDPALHFLDSETRKHTYLLEVALVRAFYSADIALYKIVNVPDEMVRKIPAIELNFDFLDGQEERLYCLQGSPAGFAGRLLNDAQIEGVLDHFSIFPDDIGGNFIFEGFRYFINGYFRFGSSGAPYVFYDSSRDQFVVNAIQSEASGIQLSIKNDREGNFQYVNAIATPLHIIRDELHQLLGNY